MAKAGTPAARATVTEPSRVKKLRRELVKVIPRVPNNRTSLVHMQQKDLPELLIDYVSWRSRYIGQRPRTVAIEPAAQADPRWSTHAAGIGAFLDKVQRGDDLTPHLSIEPHTKGYAPAARAPGATPMERWSDKDFLLNVMGYHHFHLGTKVQKGREVHWKCRECSNRVNNIPFWDNPIIGSILRADGHSRAHTRQVRPFRRANRLLRTDGESAQVRWLDPASIGQTASQAAILCLKIRRRRTARRCRGIYRDL